MMTSQGRLVLQDPRFWKEKLNPYEKMAVIPSEARVSYNPEAILKFPENYVYDNATPGQTSKPRVVFDYGPSELKGDTHRDKFANWLTSKDNKMFARSMANRLWKRLFGVANMEPIDDYKDSNTIENEALYKTLGDIFIDLDFDFKALISVILNSQAYQYEFNQKNIVNEKNYKLQGVKLKRMSGYQLRDSLLVLSHGDLDRYSKLSNNYFEFEDELYSIIHEHKFKLYEMVRKAGKELLRGERELAVPVPEIMDHHIMVLEKVRELQEYYGINEEGYFGKIGNNQGLADQSASMTMSMMTASEQGSMKHPSSSKNQVTRAHRKGSDLMHIFGASERTKANTEIDNDVTKQQILGMIAGKEARMVVKSNSYLMRNMFKEKYFKKSNSIFILLNLWKSSNFKRFKTCKKIYW